MLKQLKKFLPVSIKPRRVLMGPYEGIKLSLDLHCQSQLYFGFFERETHKYLRELSAGVKTAVDIGAGSGEQTLFFIIKTSAVKVYAFEPQESERRRLLDNLRENNLTNTPKLELSEKCISNKNDKDFTTLDDSLKNIETPCFLKMDIEGAEADALEGARQLLKKEGIRWLIETHSSEVEKTCIAILKQNNYRIKIIDKAWWRCILPEQRPRAHNRWLVADKER